MGIEFKINDLNNPGCPIEWMQINPITTTDVCEKSKVFHA
jgi:hypothetical protein